MQVKVRNNNVEAALRILKKKSAERIYEVKDRQYYEKPSLARKSAKQAAARREQKRKK